MKVVILCGGQGMRLREETEFRPKPMVTIGDKPILWHIMKIYAHYGFKEFVLCLGYKGEKIRSYFEDKANREKDWTVISEDTGKMAEKGARLKRIQKYITGDNFMMTYGDGIADLDIAKLVDFHVRHGKLATMTGVHPRSPFGEVRFDKDGTVTQFIEKPQFYAETINGGFFVLNTKIFDYLEDKDECDFESGILSELVNKGQAAGGDPQVMVHKHDGWWACMDTYRDTLYLNELWNKNKAPWQVWK